MIPAFADIERAAHRFEGVIWPSPLVRSGYFTRTLGADICLKLENLQETGAFKVRGAYNRLSQLTPHERQQGVIAASAGNHAQGIAWASARLGISATLIMPEDVSIRKLLAVKEYGAEVILSGGHYNDACLHAEALCNESGKIFVPAFDDPDIIAGQGTIGLELAERLTREVAIVAPVGGGGLISGIAIAAKTLCPAVRMIGVQARACPSAVQSVEKQTPVTVNMAPTLADGIAVNRPGDITFPIIQKYVDEMVLVEEEGIAGAVLSLMDKAHVLVEGAGATSLAALLDGQIATKASEYILIISGGNIELNTIDRILERGSIQMGRLVRLEVNVLDVPGSLHGLLGVISREKANILHIYHDRLDLQNPIEVSRVILNLETRGHDHARELVDKLRHAGYPVKQIF